MKSEGTKGTDRYRRRTNLVTLRMLHVAFGKFWAENGLLTNCYISLATELSPRKEKKNFQNMTSHSTLSVPKKEPTSFGLELQFCKNAHSPQRNPSGVHPSLFIERDASYPKAS